MLKSGYQNIRRTLKRLAYSMGIAGALSAAVVVQAQASASCDAVNAGAFELTNTALGPSSSSILTGWTVGDVLTVNITSADGLSRTDGLYHGPTFAVGSFGPLATRTVPLIGTITFQYVVTATDLTNGIAVDPENNDSVVVGCGLAPTITASGVTPNTGSTSGGTSVTITGTGFTGVTTAVTFGGTAASFAVNSLSQITATTPAHAAGTVDVAVTTGAGTATATAAFTYVPPLTVTGVAPNKGPAVGGTSVVITGTGFTGATSVNFGATSASFTVNSDTQIMATSPPGNAGPIDVTVTTSGGTSATSAADQFTYIPPPNVTAVTPNNGPIGGATAVTITGTNFISTSAVKFGNTTATFTVSSATQISANSPAGSAGTVDVTVTTPGGTSKTSASDQFSYGSSRTWVSSLGSDSNQCTRSAPCLTFAVAMANTMPGGEINVLDPGDFGPLIITQAIDIYNDNVGVAGAFVSGISAITIQAGASDVVNLRGLTLDGGGASNDGVLITKAGFVNIVNCVIQGFGTGSTAGLAGINISPVGGIVNVEIENSTVLNNKVGVIIAPANGATAKVSINSTQIDNNNGGGIRSDGTSGGTILANISNSSVSQNAGNGVIASSGTGGSVTVSMRKDFVAFSNATGVLSNQAGGGIATVTLESSQIFGNGVGLQSISGGAVLSHLDNDVSGNTSDGSFTGSTGLQ